jgi:formate dehydrogenase subunit beta
MSMTMSEQIRAAVIRLFADKQIELFIGYEEGSLPLRCRPLFIRAPEQGGVPAKNIEKLVWNAACANNLAVFLPALFEQNPAPASKPPGRVGLVVKGCDLRALDVLIRERQVRRENLCIIGVPCGGIIDAAGLEAAGMKDPAEAGDPPEDRWLEAGCLECRFPLPAAAAGEAGPAPAANAGRNGEASPDADLRPDIVIAGEARAPAADGYVSLRAQEERSAGERWDYFEAEMAKCIRCNACRQACPLCYCRECFADQLDPRWLGAGAGLSDTMLFHITRILHAAGRCVACDACVRACPTGVDLRSFTRRIVKDAEEFFGYLPGCGGGETPPLSAFREDDREDFFTEPEH